jgi:hypothetical protein
MPSNPNIPPLNVPKNVGCDYQPQFVTEDFRRAVEDEMLLRMTVSISNLGKIYFWNHLKFSVMFERNIFMEM